MNTATIEYTTTTSTEELEQILTLQKANLPTSISSTEKQAEGFVTVHHTLDILQSMHDKQPHIIAKDGNTVVGYSLCMLKEFKEDIEVLKPMFDILDTQIPSNRSYVVVGQICIDKNYRKQGIFRKLYQTMKDELSDTYDLLITEIAVDNVRSIAAHTSVGFDILHTYSADEIEWHIVQWDWK